MKKAVAPKIDREAYLVKAVAMFRSTWAKQGVAVPTDVKVTCGWPGGGSPRKRIGECWPRSRSAAKVNEMFISPWIADTAQVLDVLGHEILHAVDDCQSGHGAQFTKLSKQVGYSGGKHSAASTDEAKALLASIEAKLGKYPHFKVEPSQKKRNASHGLHKFECANGNGDVLYSTAKMVGEFGNPQCRCCREDMLPVDRKEKKLIETV